MAEVYFLSEIIDGWNQDDFSILSSMFKENYDRKDPAKDTKNKEYSRDSDDKSSNELTSSDNNDINNDKNRVFLDPWNLEYLLNFWIDKQRNRSRLPKYTCKIWDSIKESETLGALYLLRSAIMDARKSQTPSEYRELLYELSNNDIELIILRSQFYQIRLEIGCVFDDMYGIKEIQDIVLKDVDIAFFVDDGTKAKHPIEIDCTPFTQIDYLTDKLLKSGNLRDEPIIEYIIDLREYRIAKAAIMSRNMSHNIGSHVLSYIQNDITNKVSNKEYLNGINHIVSYLQERQDYIATISNDWYPPCSTLNFKDDIYDFLNPDYKSARHKDSSDKVDNLLLRYIAYSEKIYRPLINGINQDGTIIREKLGESIHGLTIKYKDFTGEQTNSIDLDDMRGWDVSVPGGVMGRQAFYSIIENIIRNAAKHDKLNSNADLEIRIDKYDKHHVFETNELGEFECDYLENETKVSRSEYKLGTLIQKAYQDNDKKDSYYYIVVTVNVQPGYLVLRKLRTAIAEPYLKEHLILETNKGIKEMRISASFLRSEQENLIERLQYNDNETFDFDNPPTIMVRLSEQGCLQYIICMLKPKELAYIVKEDCDKPKYSDMIQKEGWMAFTEDEYIQLHVKNYNYVIVESNVDYEKIRRNTGCYCYSINEFENEIQKSLRSNNPDIDIVLNALGRLSSSYMDGEKIVVYDPMRSDDYYRKNNNNIVNDYILYKKDYNQYKGIANLIYAYYGHYDNHNDKIGIRTDTISGGNSTDRIVRHCKHDNNWFYKNLRALKTTVAIFDERLYDNAISNGNLKGLILEDKGVFVYNLIENKQEKSFSLFCTMNDYYDKAIARISWDKSENQLIIKSTNELLKVDTFSVHQGLFDKMYDTFEIDNKEQRINMICQFYENFCNNPSVFEDPKFCCRMTIHSGRSKPGVHQMPIRLPFISYDSLMHSVNDSKYTLVQLLDTAIYE